MITNFSGGMVTNFGDHAPRYPHLTAERLFDCRADDRGWLVHRKGRTKLADENDVTAVFVHKGFIFIVVNHETLKWANTETLNFQTLGSVTVQAFIRGHINFTPIEIEGDEFIVIGGLSPEPKIIDLSRNTPTLANLHLPAFGENTGIQLIVEQGEDVRATILRLRQGDSVGIYMQAVTLNTNGNRIAVGPLSASLVLEAKDPDDPTQTINALKVWDPETTTTQLAMTITSIENTLIANGVTHLQFFSTKIGEPDNTSELFSLGEPIAYAVGNTNRFIYNTRFLSRTSDYIEVGEKPNIQYLAVDNFRSYAAEPDGKKLYFSYYDAETHERLYHNFTDFDNIELQGGEITGVHFLNETRLIIFATNQIQMYSVDPDPQFIQVFEINSPGTDKGKTIGCAAPQSIVNMGNNFIFLATNNYLYSLDERGLVPINDPIYALFQTIRQRRNSRGKLLLNHAVAFAHGENYVISVPIADDEPTRTIEYDTISKSWWQDKLGIYAISKDESDRLYGVVDGQLHAIYEGNDDNGENIVKNWKGNPYFTRSHDYWDSVHVYAQGPAVIDVIATTEQDKVEQTIESHNAGDWWGQKLGLGLRGRIYQVEITTSSDAPIDRITINEPPPRRRHR